jgi:hypothetical protein
MPLPNSLYNENVVNGRSYKVAIVGYDPYLCSRKSFRNLEVNPDLAKKCNPELWEKYQIVRDCYDLFDFYYGKGPDTCYDLVREIGRKSEDYGHRPNFLVALYREYDDESLDLKGCFLVCPMYVPIILESTREHTVREQKLFLDVQGIAYGIDTNLEDLSAVLYDVCCEYYRKASHEWEHRATSYSTREDYFFPKALACELIVPSHERDTELLVSLREQGFLYRGESYPCRDGSDDKTYCMSYVYHPASDEYSKIYSELHKEFLNTKKPR